MQVLCEIFLREIAIYAAFIQTIRWLIYLLSLNQRVTKRQFCKPGSVRTVFAVASIIHLGYFSRNTSIDLPFWLASDRAGRPLIQIYSVFQLARFIPIPIHTGTSELLPHFFTLTPNPSGRYFSVTLSVNLSAPFPLGSAMPCVARTFLLAHASR